MAAKLPTTLGERATPSARSRVWQVDNTALAQAQGRIARNTIQTGRDMLEASVDREKQAEKDSMLDAVRRDNVAQQEVNTLLYGDDTTEGLYSLKGGAALNSQSVFQERFKEIKNRAMEGVSNPVAQAALEKSLMSMETSNLGGVSRFVAEQRTGYRNVLLENSNKINNERVGLQYNDPETLNSALGRAAQIGAAEAKVGGFLPGDGMYERIIKSKESGVYATQINSMYATKDPAVMAKAVALYDTYATGGKLDFDTRQALATVTDEARNTVTAYSAFTKLGGSTGNDDIDFVMNDLEGGDKLVPDGGGSARFGINDVANPDVDLKNLDAAGARRIYKERYWDANSISDLPQDMQLLAFDTAVNHGSAFKNQILKDIKNGATKDEVFNKRLNEYERLARENPAKYADALPGWKNRLKKLYDRTEGGGGMPSKIDEKVAADVAASLPAASQKTFLDLVNQNNQRITAAENIERRAIVDDAMSVLNSGQGFAGMTPDLMARAQQSGIMQDLQNYNGATDPNMANYLYGLDPATLAKTELGDPSIRLKLSPADYERWTNKKERLSDSQNLVTEERRKKLVSDAFLKRDINTNEKAGKQQALRLNEMLDLEIDSFTRGNNGRYPNEAELTKIVDGLFIKGDYDSTPGSNWNPLNWGGGRDYVFDMEADDIPNAERLQIEQALQAKGVAVTESAIVKTWIMQNGR